MNLTRREKLLVCNPFRVFLQRKIEAPRVLSNLNIPEESVCIEIGCGHGAGALLIKKHISCKHLVCIDLDPDMIAVAGKYVSDPPKWAGQTASNGIEFVCEDATLLSFQSSSFDAAFLFGVLNDIPNWRNVIYEIYRILKPGGIFSFKEALITGASFYFSRLYGHMPHIEEDELKNTLREAGFTIQSFDIKKNMPACFVKATKIS